MSTTTPPITASNHAGARSPYQYEARIAFGDHFANGLPALTPRAMACPVEPAPMTKIIFSGFA